MLLEQSAREKPGLLYGKSEGSFLKVHDDLTGYRLGRVQAFAWNFAGIEVCPSWTVSLPTLHHRVDPFPEKEIFFFFFFTDPLPLQTRHGGERRTAPRCLLICTIISSCTKAQRQDIWCNTIAGSVPRGAPVCCVQSDLQERPSRSAAASPRHRDEGTGISVCRRLLSFPPSPTPATLSHGFTLLRNYPTGDRGGFAAAGVGGGWRGGW